MVQFIERVDDFGPLFCATYNKERVVGRGLFRPAILKWKDKCQKGTPYKLPCAATKFGEILGGMEASEDSHYLVWDFRFKASPAMESLYAPNLAMGLFFLDSWDWIITVRMSCKLV